MGLIFPASAASRTSLSSPHSLHGTLDTHFFSQFPTELIFTFFFFQELFHYFFLWSSTPVATFVFTMVWVRVIKAAGELTVSQQEEQFLSKSVSCLSVNT